MMSDGARAVYLLCVLLAVYVLAFVDRQIIGLLAAPLQQDLGLTDTEIGLLHGGAFALVLGLASVPIGRLIDGRRRVTLVAAGVAFWSLATFLCGFADGLWTLLLLRAGVALGEAVLTPAAHSMIADAFSPKRLGTALAVYGTGPHLGGGAALILGSWALAAAQGVRPDLAPWRLVMMMIGLPGLVAAVWVLSAPEPARGRAGSAAPLPPVAEVIAFFARHWRAFLLLKLSTAFAAMMIYGLMAWAPTFFVRSHGWTTVQAGLALGPVVAVTGVAGVLAGGILSDAAIRRHRLGRMVVIGCAALLAAPAAAAGALAADPGLALAWYGLALFCGTVAAGSGPAATMEMAPARMRGVASALGVLIVNLIGLGAGPVAIALVTDRVFGDPSALRFSLALLLPAMAALAGICALAGLRPYAASLSARVPAA